MVSIAVVAGLIAALGAGCGSDDGEAVAEDSPRVEAAVERYRSYLEDRSEELAEATRRLAAKVEGGEILKAQSRYAAARVWYGQVEPVAELLNLDSRIEAPPNPPDDGSGGFPRIEKALWDEVDTDEMNPVARQLHYNAEELWRRVQTADLRATEILAAIAGQLDEVSTATIQGKEDTYSHIGMLDVAANAEGAQAAFDAVKPLVADEDLVTEIESALEAIFATVGEYGTLAHEPEQQRARAPGVSFILLTQVPQSAKDELARQIDALDELLSQVPG